MSAASPTALDSLASPPQQHEFTLESPQHHQVILDEELHHEELLPARKSLDATTQTPQLNVQHQSMGLHPLATVSTIPNPLQDKNLMKRVVFIIALILVQLILGVLFIFLGAITVRKLVTLSAAVPIDLVVLFVHVAIIVWMVVAIRGEIVGIQNLERIIRNVHVQRQLQNRSNSHDVAVLSEVYSLPTPMAQAAVENQSNEGGYQDFEHLKRAAYGGVNSLIVITSLNTMGFIIINAVDLYYVAHPYAIWWLWLPVLVTAVTASCSLCVYFSSRMRKTLQKALANDYREQQERTQAEELASA